ncbi:MAG TPA: SCO family protein [Pyrinomonadaceae bacterium]|nr:SCO family protein [Pyrinomonadaceae bacterium]
MTVEEKWPLRRNDLEINEMNKQSTPKPAAIPRMESRTRSRPWKALVLVVMFAGIGEAQVFSKTGGHEQNSQQKKTTTKQVKSYVCPMHPEVKSTKRGKCPKCKMDLRLERDVTSTAVTGNQNLIANNARKMVIPEVEVLDQNGNSLHFYSDLIKGKTVAINFIFTNCTTICPPLGATFARVQKEMGDMVGRDVHFISISVDPLTDTPERLRAWGAKFKAGAGWTFVTGNKEQIDNLLYALGASVSRREDHSPTVIIGNDPKGVWTRTYGLATSAQMVGLIMNVIAGKTDESLTKETAKP